MAHLGDGEDDGSPGSERYDAHPDGQRYLRAMLTAEPADLARVSVPTLVIGGSDDQFLGDGVMEEAVAALPAGRLVTFPGETLMAPVEVAGSFRAALTTVLDA